MHTTHTATGRPEQRDHPIGEPDISVYPAELHIYPRGRRGLGLANGVAYGAHGQVHVPHTSRWAQACEAWLGAEGFLVKEGCE